VPEPVELVLASGSRARRDMLKAAGLEFDVVPADVDEPALRERLQAENPRVEGGDIAVALARAKAEAVSLRRPGALVIGADQVLTVGQRVYEKPQDVPAARTSLLELRGVTHELFSGVALAQDGGILWSDLSSARLTMRAFSMEFLDEYLVNAGGRLTESVGAYQLEGLGLQLFERVDGDYFTILGMPLLPLLAELRARGFIGT